MKLQELKEWGEAPAATQVGTAQQANMLSMSWEGLDKNDNPVDFKINVAYTGQGDELQTQVVSVEYKGQTFSQKQAEQMWKANSNNPNEPLFDPQLVKDNVADELFYSQAKTKVGSEDGGYEGSADQRKDIRDQTHDTPYR